MLKQNTFQQFSLWLSEFRIAAQLHSYISYSNSKLMKRFTVCITETMTKNQSIRDTHCPIMTYTDNGPLQFITTDFFLLNMVTIILPRLCNHPIKQQNSASRTSTANNCAHFICTLCNTGMQHSELSYYLTNNIFKHLK